MRKGGSDWITEGAQAFVVVKVFPTGMVWRGETGEMIGVTWWGMIV